MCSRSLWEGQWGAWGRTHRGAVILLTASLLVILADGGQEVLPHRQVKVVVLHVVERGVRISIDLYLCYYDLTKLIVQGRGKSLA